MLAGANRKPTLPSVATRSERARACPRAFADASPHGGPRTHKRPRRPSAWSTRASKGCPKTRARGIRASPEGGRGICGCGGTLLRWRRSVNSADFAFAEAKKGLKTPVRFTPSTPQISKFRELRMSRGTPTSLSLGSQGPTATSRGQGYERPLSSREGPLLLSRSRTNGSLAYFTGTIRCSYGVPPHMIHGFPEFGSLE